MIPLQPMERTTVQQVVLSAHGEDHTRAVNHPAARAGLHAGVGGCLFPEETVACGEATLEQIFLTSTAVCGGLTLK